VALTTIGTEPSLPEVHLPHRTRRLAYGAPGRGAGIGSQVWVAPWHPLTHVNLGRTDSQEALLAVAMLAAGLAIGYGERRDWALQVMKDGAIFGGSDDER
jgi:hypothetical protein